MVNIGIFSKTPVRPIILLGKFDGLHTGHKTLVDEGERLKQSLNSPVYIFNFLHDESGKKKYLSTTKEKILLEEQSGIDGVIEAPLTKDFFSIDKDEFLSILSCNFNPVAVVCGEDYTFGFNRGGDAFYLKDYFEKMGVKAVIAPLLKINGEKISSTLIRNLLVDGKIEEANALLGYSYSFSGIVEKGRGDGKLFGFPTANVMPDKTKFMPREGVYKTKIKVCGKVYDSVTNVGNAPTFSSLYYTTETFIPNFSGDLYGKRAEIAFFEYLRPIKKFDTTELLYKQIKEDVSKL